MESVMRQLSGSISLIVCGIALYFALHWGLDAFRIFMSPIYGLEDANFARIVYGIGRMANLGPEGLMRSAAFFGALKLGVATIFVIYLVHRLTGLGQGIPEHDLLEAGLVLVVVTVGALALPAFLQDAGIVLNQFRVPLWLVGLAATLTMVERAAQNEPARTRLATCENEIAARTIEAGCLAPVRGRVSAIRWNLLRREANLAAHD
jgi:hypothetical protein